MTDAPLIRRNRSGALRTATLRGWLLALTTILCAGCATPERTPLVQHEEAFVLLDPRSELGDDWEHRRLRRGDTAYERTESALGHTIRAVGRRSASILFRVFDETDPGCDTLEWQWHVDQPQPGSDLRTKGKDDVAASVFVLFGDPGIFRDRLVPTLKYVWANNRHQEGDIIAGPYYEEYVRTIVVRTGGADGKRLVTNRTRLFEDFERAFGKPPEGGVHGIAVFTDNDDTGEPITAHYGRIVLLCGT
jgi:hypothetical protein